MSLPKSMKALLYSKPKEHSLVEVPLPEIRENDVLVRRPQHLTRPTSTNNPF